MPQNRVFSERLPSVATSQHSSVRSAKCAIQVSYRRKSLRPYGLRYSPGSPDPGYKRTAFIRVDRYPSAVVPLRGYSDTILKDASVAAEPRFEICSQNRETPPKEPLAVEQTVRSAASGRGYIKPAPFVSIPVHSWFTRAGEEDRAVGKGKSRLPLPRPTFFHQISPPAY